MKLAVCLMMTSVAFAACWDAVQRVSPDHKVEVTTKGETARGTFVSASETALVFRTKSGEQSIQRTDVRKVRVADPSRRMRNGLLGSAIGLGAGIGLGFAICPYCPNEGNGGKFIGPMSAAGAGAGAAAGFLPSPYRTIYRQ